MSTINRISLLLMATAIGTAKAQQQYLPLTGGTLSGGLNVNGPISINRAPLFLAAPNDYNHAIGTGIENFWNTTDGETFSYWSWLNFRSASNGGSAVFIGADGKVGIGTTAPSGRLEIKGNDVGGETSPEWQLRATKNFSQNNGLGAGPGILFSHHATDGFGGVPMASNMKQAGIAAPAEDNNYSRKVGLGFWTSDFDRDFSEKMRISGSGNVGIGLSDNIQSMLTLGGGNLSFKHPDNSTGLKEGMTWRPEGSWSFDAAYIKGYREAVPGAPYAITFGTGRDLWLNERMRINSDGNVGIGTTAPLALLHVNGKVLIGTPTAANAYDTSTVSYMLDIKGSARANKLTVNTTGADFVFEPSYKLMPLAEVEGFVKRNLHLPGIAPAAEMQKEGIEIGEQQAKMLQKLEEELLYIIKQSKEIESMARKMAEQDKRITELEAAIKK